MWLLFLVLFSLVLGEGPVGNDEPASMYNSEEEEVGHNYVTVEEDSGEGEKEPWDQTDTDDNYDSTSDVEDLDKEESRLLKQASSSESEEVELAEEKPKKADEKEDQLSAKEDEGDNEIKDMQAGLEKSQKKLKSMMNDFQKSLDSYENTKFEDSVGDDDSEESDSDSEESTADSEESASDSEESDSDSEESTADSEESASDSEEEESSDEEMKVQQHAIDANAEDYEEAVGEEFNDEDFDFDEDWDEEAVGETPLEYDQWYEHAMGQIEHMDDMYDDIDPELDMQDFEEVLVGDPYIDLHHDMNDMYENLLGSDEEAVGDYEDW